ncbi:hypothetical protein HFN89_00045 [Rhizobium laguerreae]|nr:hypothetical protein [Rhizobium laguerreae]
MLLKDFGPFPGMTYLGRQNIDAIVIDAASTSKAALIRLVERQTDAVSDETTVLSGNAAYAKEWNERNLAGTGLSFVAAAIFAVAAIGFIATKFYTNFAVATPPRQEIATFLSVIAKLAFLFGAAILAMSGSPSIRAIRTGYTREVEQAFRRLAAESWVIGDKALYISCQGSRDNRPVVKTVFYDAIGTVDVEPTGGGLDGLFIRSRDGSDIASMIAPVTAVTDNTYAIADAIYTRLND